MLYEVDLIRHSAGTLFSPHQGEKVMSTPISPMNPNLPEKKKGDRPE